MSMGFIIWLPLLAGFGFLYWSSLLDGEDWDVFKLMLRLMFLPLTFLSIHFAIIDATLTYASNSDLVSTLAMFAEYLGYLMYLVGLYILYVLIKGVVRNLQGKKMSEEADRHD